MTHSMLEWARKRLQGAVRHRARSHDTQVVKRGGLTLQPEGARRSHSPYPLFRRDHFLATKPRDCGNGSCNGSSRCNQYNTCVAEGRGQVKNGNEGRGQEVYPSTKGSLAWAYVG